MQAPKLASVLLDSQRRLRNGWWVATFVALVAISRPVYKGVSHAFGDLGVPKPWLEPLPFLFVLGVTWVCTRLRREPLASVGFVVNRRWLRELGVGVALSAASILLVAATLWAIDGVSFTLDPARSAILLARGAYVFLFVALLEETLARGFVFQRLLDGMGVWIAQLLVALLFATGHWGNPGMHGVTLVVASLSLATGSLLLGLAYVRTRSLALPVGLHLGWNWMQGSVLGFGVSGHEQIGWLRPVFGSRPEWLTGGAFGPEASVLAVLVDLGVIALLWRWRGVEPTKARP